MNKAAKKLEGEHDFRNFCKMDVSNGVVQFKRAIASFVIKKGSILPKGQENVQIINCDESSMDGYEMCEAVICGSAFLWHQVRCMMSVILMVGQRLETPEIIDWLLDVKNCPQRPQYNMALEFPLVLYDCVFEDIPWVYEPAVLQSVYKHLQHLWSVHGIRATMLRDLINLVNDVPVSGNDDSLCSSATSVKLSQYNQSGFLILGENCKTHKLLKKRAMCESFEQKLENVNSKRVKKGKELLAPKVTEIKT